MAHFRAVLTRARSHIFDNAVAYLALFVALGGTSYGLASGSIGSREIRNNSVRTGDLRNNEVRSRDIRNRTIVGRDVLSNTLGGDQIDETELGEVPLATRAKSADDALALDGLPPSSFARPPATATVDVEDDNAAAVTVLPVPGYGALSVPASGCEADAGSEELTYTWANASTTTRQDLFQLRSSPGSTTPVHVVLDAAADSDATVAAQTLYVQLRVRPEGSPSSAATVTVFARIGGPVSDGCRVSAQALVSG